MNSILVVDDDADSREAVARFLRKAGYAVRSAPNGREALIAVASAMPDLVIVDARMPEMSGVEFLRVIRSYLYETMLPAVMLTAFDSGEHVERARELGVRRVFLKANFRLRDLGDCVAELLRELDETAAG